MITGQMLVLNILTYGYIPIYRDVVHTSSSGHIPTSPSVKSLESSSNIATNNRTPPNILMMNHSGQNTKNSDSKLTNIKERKSNNNISSNSAHHG